MKNIYDVIIIGAGPAGLSAGLYAARAKLSTLLFEKSKVGGQIATTDEVANYPGAVPGSTGPSLVTRMLEQCRSFGVVLKKEAITSIVKAGDLFIVTSEKETYHARSVIASPGVQPRLLGVPGEREFTGRGVAYCATCDADFFTDLEIFVIGGGDSAVEEAIFLTKFARKVTIVHRRDQLAAAKSIQEKAFKNEKISFLWDTVVTEIKGEGIVESIIFKNVKTQELHEYEADEAEGTFGVFVFIGFIPQTELFKGLLEMNDAGFIISNEDMKTNVAGLFVAGDCRAKSLKQLVTAVSDGAIAAVQAEKYIEATFH